MNKEIINRISKNIEKQNYVIKYLESQLREKINLRNMLIKKRKEAYEIYSFHLKSMHNDALRLNIKHKYKGEKKK